MSHELDSDYEDEGEFREYEQYRSLSVAAVATIAIAVLSLAAIVFPSLLFLPLAGVLLGLYAYRKTQVRADELTGQGMATVGLGLCLLILFGAGGMHWIIYATEVPEGYERISFWQLDAGPGQPESSIPPAALELDGKRVFVKGYVFPHTQRLGLKQFVLVGDMGTCCFGGQPKLTDMIEVTLEDPLTINFSYRPRRLAGTFKVNRILKNRSDVGGVCYQLEADYVK